MTPHDLIANFETLAEAPNGVLRLRELVLELAVRGKLVKQDPEEGTASHQFKNLCIGNVESGGPKRGRQLKGPDAPEPAPDNLPKNALWVPIGQLMDLYNGRAFKPNEWTTTGLPIIRIQNLNNPEAPFNYCDFEVPKKVHVKDGDLLISWSGTPGTSFGAFIWNRGNAVLNQHIFRVELRNLNLVPEYIRLSVNARLDEMISRAHGGVGLRHITKGELEAIGIPIPPQAEQRRIVARVDELMALLDRLEAKGQARECTRAAARDSALAALRDAPSPEEVETAWLRIQDRFKELFASPEDVEPIRQAILQAAIQGRLLPQDPSNGSAEALLGKVSEKKAQLIKSGKIRPTKPSKPVTRDGSPWTSAEGWAWVRVQDVGEVKLGRQRSPEHHKGPHMTPYLRVANVHEAQLRLDDVKQMNFTPEEQVVFRLEEMDILLNEGQSLELVGRPAIYRGEIPGVCFQNTLLRFRLFEPEMSEFALIVFRAYLHSKRFQMASQQTTNIAHLSSSRLASIEFPVPPLAEQLKIVTRVEELMSLLDRLSASLASQRDIKNAIAAAAVHHLDF